MLRVLKWRSSTILRLDCDGCGAHGPAIEAPVDPDAWDIAATRAAFALGWTFTRKIQGRSRLIIAHCAKCAGTRPCVPQLRFVGIA